MSHIKIAFKKALGISLPGQRGCIEPKLHPHVKQVPGFPHPVPVQEHHLEDGDHSDLQHAYKRDTYDIALKPEHPQDLPASLKGADPEIRKAFLVAQASDIAANHAENNELREALRGYAERGIIEILEDTGLEAPAAPAAEAKPAKKPAAEKAAE